MCEYVFDGTYVLYEVNVKIENILFLFKCVVTGQNNNFISFRFA